VEIIAVGMAGAIPLFRSLTLAERNELLRNKTRRTYQAGEVIAPRGSVMRALVAWEDEAGAPLEGIRY
jgi:hypothetical protein